MSTVLNSIKPDSLTISLRLLRFILSAVLVFTVATEPAITQFWQVTLSALALYTFITAVIGRDPLFAHLRRGSKQVYEHNLDLVAQLECLSIGLICFLAGMLNQFSNSLLFMLLPFLGIYPIVLCIMKHDLLGFLLQSYRQ